ncbi:MAG: peptidyl-prolyl cis-trans isomerase [Haliea sp.]|nr:peptidyl-prolyl cis-trans isomerase [Haliea sp.]
MKQLLREPLVHFLFIGMALFATYYYLQPSSKAAPSAQEIQLSVGDLEQLAVLFQSQWQRDPTTEEFGLLVEQKVQSEVLYREALALGLDKNDEIVKRRMAQKMQFLAEDVAAAQEPTTGDLKAWYATQTDTFAMPKRVSFRHLYFSPDRRGENARGDAAKLLAQLTDQPQAVKLPESSADPFMFQEYYRDRAPDFLGKEFGPQFALSVADLTEGSWQGPIESGFGWHLVFVDTTTPGRIPDFEEVEADVKAAWLAEQKVLAWDKAYRAMRAKYKVLLPMPPADTGMDTAAAANDNYNENTTESRTPSEAAQ